MTLIRERIYDGLRQVQRMNYPVSNLVIHLGEEAYRQYLKEFRPAGFGTWETETPLGLPIMCNPAIGDDEVRLRYEVYA